VALTVGRVSALKSEGLFGLRPAVGYDDSKTWKSPPLGKRHTHLQYLDWKRIEFSHNKMRHAEDALRCYVEGGMYDPEKYKELLDAASMARDIYIERLEALSPRMSQPVSHPS